MISSPKAPVPAAASVHNVPLQRADARGNREQLLQAARDVFRLHGFDAPLEAIAQQAGVSRTTLYRHFPDREHLAFAIFDQNMCRLERKKAALGDSPYALQSMIETVGEIIAEDIGSSDILRRLNTDYSMLEGMNRKVVNLLAPLLTRAQEARKVRKDLSEADLGIILSMLGSVEARPETRQRQIRRALELILGGVLAV